MKMVQLPKSKVELGQPLPWNVRDAQTKLLLTKGYVIESAYQLDLILERGAFVDVEEVKAWAQEPKPAGAVVLPPNLFDLWNQTAEGLKSIVTRMEQADFSHRLGIFAQRIIQLMDVNPDIALYRSVRQETAQNFWYGYNHAIHTAVLCVLLARRLHWSQPRMMSLLKAALTMNVSILELQGEMAAQDVPVRDRQRELIHQHPTAAVEQLRQAGITDEDWLGAIAQHHERPDGGGYPQKITDMGEMAVALRVTDVFMAKISLRAVRAALSPQDAIRQLYGEDKGGPLSTAVIKEFGIYPPGDFVKLATGEYAVVVQRTANAKAPIVAVITDTQGKPIAKTVRQDTGQKEFVIVGVAADKSLLKRLAPERLYGYMHAPGLDANG